MKKVYALSILLSIICISCRNQEFIKTKSAAQQILALDGSTLVKVSSYEMSYNPKSNGTITIQLESGAEYKAKSVDGGSFSSIKILLNEGEVLFDTSRKEIYFKKSFRN